MTALPMVKAQIYLNFGSQKEFASRVGMGELDVSRVVCGRKILIPAEQARWAQVLNVKKDVLFPEQAEVAKNG